MKNNILSFNQLLEKGYEIYLKENNLSMGNIGNLIANVPISRNRMFLLNIQNDVTKRPRLATKLILDLVLRFGHLNFVGLELLSKK